MFIDIDGTRVYYEVKGEGDTVVLMHGWGGSTVSFEPVFNYLQKFKRVFSFDFPGFGRSDTPPSVWGTIEYGELVEKFFRVIRIERADIVAHSFGGRVALWFAANFPERVKRLLLVNSAGIKPKRKPSYYIKVGIAKTGKKLLLLPIFGKYGEGILNRLYRLIGSKDYQQQSGVMRNTLVKVVNEDLRGLLPDIMAPTLLIWGENDNDVPLYYGKVMEKEIKDAGLVVFKEAGHFSYLDKLNDFCRILKEFLK